MPLSRRPTRKQSRRCASSLTLIFFAFMAIILLCPVVAPVGARKMKANHPEMEVDSEGRGYGRVIGIGAPQNHVGKPGALTNFS